MQSKKQLTQDIAMTSIGRDVAEIFESSAAGHIRTIRDSIVSTRQFLDEVGVVYQQVKQSYFQSLREPVQTSRFRREVKEDPELAVLHKNGKIVQVLLSANKGLYGDLPLRIASECVRQYLLLQNRPDKKPVDMIVIGRLGQFLLQNFPIQGKVIPFTFYPLDDEKPSEASLQQIIDALVVYDEVYVSYGKFQSLLSQIPETVNISGGSDLATAVPQSEPVGQGSNAKSGPTKILFEPSVKSVASFFEKEVLGALFRQKLYEMELARLASRMVAMDGAVDRANQQLRGLERVARRLKRDNENKKLEQLFGGMQLW